MNAKRILAMVVLAAVAILAPVSVASAGDGYEAPEIETHVPVTAILYALVFLVGIAVVGFKNARRTHLD